MPSPKKPPTLRKGHPNTQRPDTDVVLRDEQPVIPKPPSKLLARSRQRWAAYWESPLARAVDAVTDLHAVERWIRAVDEYERVLPEVIAERTVKGSMGQNVLNPLAGYLQNLKDEIRRAEEALGLTPKARTQLGIAYAEADLARRKVQQARAQEWEADEEEEDPRLMLVK